MCVQKYFEQNNIEEFFKGLYIQRTAFKIYFDDSYYSYI